MSLSAATNQGLLLVAQQASVGEPGCREVSCKRRPAAANIQDGFAALQVCITHPAVLYRSPCLQRLRSTRDPSALQVPVLERGCGQVSCQRGSPVQQRLWLQRPPEPDPSSGHHQDRDCCRDGGRAFCGLSGQPMCSPCSHKHLLKQLSQAQPQCGLQEARLCRAVPGVAMGAGTARGSSPDAHIYSKGQGCDTSVKP